MTAFPALWKEEEAVAYARKLGVRSFERLIREANDRINALPKWERQLCSFAVLREFRLLKLYYRSAVAYVALHHASRWN